MICSICKKDLTDAASTLGANEVRTIHRSVHIEEAIIQLLKDADDWPELYDHFEPLRRALAL